MNKQENKKPNFEYVKMHPARWNLLDMINLIGRASVPATLFYDIDVTWAETLREQYAALGYKVSITALLIRAIAIAQRSHPSSRTIMLPNNKMIQINDIEAQFTVERFVDEQPALFFGSVKEADTKPIVEINKELQSYGNDEIGSIPQLALEDEFSKYPWFIRQIIIFVGSRIPELRLKFMGATFGLSSLGKYGCRNLISPSVITSMFCVGEVEDRPVSVNKKVEIHPILSLVLNFDHRVIDGAAAARFMGDIIDLLQGGLEKHLASELATLKAENPDQLRASSRL